MKFKKPGEYLLDKQATSVIEKIGDAQTPAAWECIACDSRAVLLHRGTAYCRPCYDKRNYNGTLIG